MACPSDREFGPAVSGCRGNFDFTIKFEDIILSLVPSALFFVLAAARICAAHLCILILTASGQNIDAETLSLVATSLAFVASIFIIPLTVLEHSRSKRPSFLLSVYLFGSLLCDVVQTRTRWLATVAEFQITLARLFTVSVVVKLGLLILESLDKVGDRETSAEERAGLFNLAAYTWLYPLYFKGYRNVLSVADLPTLDRHLRTATLRAKLTRTIHLKPLTTRFGLALRLARSLLLPLLLPVLPRLAVVAFRFCQPFLVHSVLDYLEHPEPENADWRNTGYGFIGAAVLIYFGLAVSTALYWYCHERFISMTRGGLVAALYDKLVRLRTVDVNDSAAVTLMSTDIERIRFGMLNLHEFWAVPIEVGLASWLLYNQLGVAFVAPLLIVITCVACSSVVNKYTASRQKQWMDRIQTRVAETAKMLGSLKQLKISGLAGPVEDSVQELRDDELKVASKFRRLYVSNMAFGFATMALSPVVTFAVTSRDLDTSTIFTSLAYMILLANPLGELFGEIPYFLAAFTSLGRIQEFLGKDTQSDHRLFTRHNSSGSSSDSTPPAAKSEFQIHMSQVSLGWTSDRPALRNVSMGVRKSGLTILIGPVGSGKSTLCKALLSDVPFSTGAITLQTYQHSFRSAFCDQIPFVWNDSIRNNIIGNSMYNPVRYQEVVDAAALDADLKTLARGDETILGTGGTSLSGGQKQRVAIARALYHEADFYVFDDSLSGLDADTEQHVFQCVFGPDGVLRRRKCSVLLATHNVGHLPHANHIVVLASDGTVSYEGNYTGLIETGLRRRSQQMEGLDEFSHLKRINNNSSPPPNFSEPANTGTSFLSAEDRMTGDSTVYKYYLSSLGKLAILAFILFGIGWGFFYNFGYIWLRFWSRDTSENHSRSFWLGLFGLCQIGGLASIILCYWTSYTMMARVSGSSLHQSALHTVIHAPLSFTTATDIGVITNLFSQDMTLIDNELPVAITNLALDICNALGIAAVIATSSPFLVISYPILLGTLYFIQRFYLRTARQLRLFDLETKSPLYTHFLDTSRGLSTLRAFNFTSTWSERASELLDASQKPAYLLAMVQRWLLFVLQCVVALLAIMVVTLATQTAGSSSSTGFTGASLVALMTFGEILNFIIRWWTQLETSIGAVTRLKALGDKVPGEGKKDETKPLVEDQGRWPAMGRIEIQGVTAAYRDFEAATDTETETSLSEKPPRVVLEDLRLSIKPGEKIAICGRSGSGKSSTILLLLRMLDPLPADSQNIYIDGIPLHSIDRSEVRKHIIAMSQDPVFLPGKDISLKRQLDPFGTCPEDECTSVLQLVGLGHLVNDSNNNQLDIDRIELQIDALSGGQKQLFNLARTILRGRARARNCGSSQEEKIGGILLLDEVSASVDSETEQTMLRIILQEFENYTIVMVSHRLEMVMGFDRVVVMDQGRIVEQGEPRVLVGVQGSRFGSLWVSSGGRNHQET
ncbi:P-loop containing nucleoside triphosphate hydrolase protein [Naviculisporaceae sp. PSN 640]